MAQLNFLFARKHDVLINFFSPLHTSTGYLFRTPFVPLASDIGDYFWDAMEIRTFWRVKNSINFELDFFLDLIFYLTRARSFYKRV